MKRWMQVLCMGATILVGLNLNARAQSSNNPAADVLEKKDAEERYQRLNSAVEGILAALAAQQKQQADFNAELQRLQEKVVHLDDQPSKYASMDDLKTLAQKLGELDQKREADKKLILEELKKLEKVPPVVHETRTEPASPPPKSDGKGYEYVIKPNDTLSGIVEAYRKEGVKVTLDQVLKANPKVKPESLQVGKSIFIPASPNP